MAQNYDFGHIHYRKKTANNACNPDFPAGGWRIRELAQGVHYTIVNGQVLLEDGRHTGALPGRVLRNTLYHATATA